MNRRLVFKTAAICTGLFIMLVSLAVFWLSRNYELDLEKRVNVAVASTDIEEGTVINESMLGIKTIKASSYNEHMIMEPQHIIGCKALHATKQGDYVRTYALLSKELLYQEDDRIVVLPMDMEDRLANLVKKGSLIDIKVLLREGGFIPQVVLSRVRVEDILSENGTSLDEAAATKKAYGKLILNEVQRNRIYAASLLGELSCELYCDSAQKPVREDFQIPQGIRELKNEENSSER
jgi:Flp pilus assembly protein CpaB